MKVKSQDYSLNFVGEKKKKTYGHVTLLDSIK